jgi:hypothetical protein
LSEQTLVPTGRGKIVDADHLVVPVLDPPDRVATSASRLSAIPV